MALTVCVGRTRWVANADRDKLLVHEKPQTKTSDSGEPYRVKDETTKECSIQLSEEQMRRVNTSTWEMFSVNLTA